MGWVGGFVGTGEVGAATGESLLGGQGLRSVWVPHFEGGGWASLGICWLSRRATSHGRGVALTAEVSVGWS